MIASACAGLSLSGCYADNALEALPESLGECTNLVKLQASFNQLKSLPASIGSLSKLELLRVACNCLEEVCLSPVIASPLTVHAPCTEMQIYERDAHF